MVRSFQLDIHPNPQAAIRRGVELWQQWAAIAIAEKGSFTVALAGGSTPKRFYEALATADLPWDKFYVFWGDERYVPLDHPDSNYRMAKEALLDRVPIPSSQVFPFPTPSGRPQTDAEIYIDRLQEVFKSPWPVLDCTLLGIGDDGHTASLFPGTEALNSQAWVTVGSKSGEPRLTLTLPVLNASDRVLFWVSGASKAAIVKQLLTTPSGLPAQAVQPMGDLIWMLDSAAASELPLHISLG